MSIEVEEWRKVPEWPMYEVSDWGRVRTYWPWRNFRTVPRLMKLVVEHNRHLSVKLSRGKGDSKTFLVARLVLMAFDRMPEPGEQACHAKNSNPRNNRLENLRWGTPATNMGEDIIRHHGHHHNAKVYPEDIREIRRLRTEGVKLRVLAAQFGLSEAAVSLIVRRKTHYYVK